MIFPVLVVDFELRTFLFNQFQFGFIEFGKSLDTMRAVIVWTLVNGHFFLRLPAKKSQSAVRTEELRLPVGFKSLLKLEKLRAYLTENLRAFLSVVEVEVGGWRATAGTDDMRWNR